MKRILICCVNFNSYDCLHIYIDSIRDSVLEVEEGAIFVDVKIADNSTQKQVFNYPSNNSLKVEIIGLDNSGYFGGAFSILNPIKDKSQYDYTIISNVDLKVDKSFFRTLYEYDYSDEIGSIAPCIYSLKEGRDKNGTLANVRG